MSDVVVTVNSPGEVATWLEPVARALLPRLEGSRLAVMIPPCTFASGAETRVVQDLLGDSERVRIFGPGQVMGYLVGRRGLPGFRPAPEGVVLFLGGDMVYAAWLARRFRYRALAYTEGRVRWAGVFERFLLPDGRALERARRRLGPRMERMAGRLEVVGDLMVDAARSRLEPDRLRRLLGLQPGEKMLLLLPGSRPAELRFLIPFYLEAVRELEQLPGTRGKAAPVRAVLPLSPFAGAEEAARLARESLQGRGGAAVSGVEAWEELGLPGSRRLVMKEGPSRAAGRPVQVELVQGASRELMGAADLAVTIPGSNTAEMGAFGLPMVVVLPLQRPEEIPLEGLPGLLGGLPGLGPALKRRAVERAAAAMPFVALPNRRAGRQVVPELRGEVSPAQVAREVARWLDDDQRRGRTRRELEALRGEPGAAARVVERVLSMLPQAAGRTGSKPGNGDRQEVMP